MEDVPLEPGETFSQLMRFNQKSAMALPTMAFCYFERACSGGVEKKGMDENADERDRKKGNGPYEQVLQTTHHDIKDMEQTRGLGVHTR